MAPTDAELVSRAVSGSQEAYRRLLERYQRPVYGLIVRMVRDPALAEDLAQEVFVKAFRALDTFNPRRKFSSWLFKIAHNATIDQLRRRRLETVPLEDPTTASADPLDRLPDTAGVSPEAALERRRLADALEEAVADLKEGYREVVLLRYREGLSYEEIAEICDLPLGTVKTHLHRARKAMARHLAARGWGPG